MPTCLTALAVTAIVSLKARSNPIPLFREMAGLFVMVETVESTQAMQHAQMWLNRLEAMRLRSAPW